MRRDRSGKGKGTNRRPVGRKEMPAGEMRGLSHMNRPIEKQWDSAAREGLSI